MSVTDTELVQSVTYMLLENGDADATGTTLLTSMFSITKIIDALNQRQYRFLKDTGIVQTRATLAPVPANVSLYTLPDDTVDVRRVTRETPLVPPAVGSTISGLTRTDAFDLDHGQADWGYNMGTPIAYHTSTLPTLQVEIEPAPVDAGLTHALLVELSATLTGTSVALTIPEEFSWVILYGALADLMSEQAEGNEPQRAAYCQMRYDLGVELARVLLRSTEPA